MSVAGGRIAAGVGANLIGQHAQDRNQDATVYVGNLDAQAAPALSPHRGLRMLPAAARTGCRARAAALAPRAPALRARAAQMTEELVWALFIQTGPVGAHARRAAAAARARARAGHRL